MQPIIGITCDTNRPTEPGAIWRHESPATYAAAVTSAGGVPILLPCEIEHIDAYLKLCDGFVLSGGNDPDTTPYGQKPHPKADLLHPARQAFESALIAAIQRTDHPVLGICLGMQMMALNAGGKLHQHLPDAPGFDEASAACHKSAPHDVRLIMRDHPYLPRRGRVYSMHHQAVADPGAMRTIAVSEQAGASPVIEAIDRPNADGRFYLGVQWHPERTDDDALGIGLFEHLIAHCRRASADLPILRK
ncbi:MAG: gamma-glutamyl-gamma-aminobutyrate hydrolase family protein [Planctomycetes bacterium]|nr:gamma-glutamyl-gamma-aminobutyrate hydrolase family protein [Planctomycetota bacterium]